MTFSQNRKKKQQEEISLFKTTRTKNKRSNESESDGNQMCSFTNVLCVYERLVEENLHDLRIKAIENRDHAKMHNLRHYLHELPTIPNVHYFHHENYKLEENQSSRDRSFNQLTSCLHPTVISISRREQISMTIKIVLSLSHTLDHRHNHSRFVLLHFRKYL